MPSMFAWLLAAIVPIVKRVLAALGVGWVTFTALTSLVDQVKSSVLSSWGAIPADILAIATMSGFGTAFGVILGAFAYKASLSAISYLGRVL